MRKYLFFAALAAALLVLQQSKVLTACQSIRFVDKVVLDQIGPIGSLEAIFRTTPELEISLNYTHGHPDPMELELIMSLFRLDPMEDSGELTVWNGQAKYEMQPGETMDMIPPIWDEIPTGIRFQAFYPDNIGNVIKHTAEAPFGFNFDLYLRIALLTIAIWVAVFLSVDAWTFYKSRKATSE